MNVQSYRSVTAAGVLDAHVQDLSIMAEVERLLSGRTRNIRLKGQVAQAFWDRTWRQAAMIVRSWLVWVMVLEGLTLVLNLVLLPQTSGVAMLLPAAMVLAAALAALLVWRKRRSNRVLHWSLTVAMFFMLLGVGLMGVAGGGELYERFLNVMVFTAITGIIIFTVPMRHTVALAAIVLSLYLLLQLQNPMVEARSALSGFFFYFCGVIATVMARRTATILAQKSFLLELRDRRHVAELAEANHRLDELSKIDPLTGVANRRWMRELLGKLWLEADTVAVLMCDIDDFKALNDQRGHAEGDRCLQQVANLIKHNLRSKQDCVARYGGEEFMILLFNATAAEALAVAEQICSSIAAAAFPSPGSRVAPFVTVSIGVAAGPTSPEKHAPERLQRQADEALYAAKRAGRNRAMVFASEPQIVPATLSSISETI
ncbi:GGDEF domain-containing protein [Devosia sp.]|uniref:GGDEF domain-containing protein n=1 Tax=Devosia sp. TaxID=1871048 RepID=UPI002FC7F358